MNYLRDWDEWVESLPNLTLRDRAKLKLSAETLEGWRITGKKSIS